MAGTALRTVAVGIVQYASFPESQTDERAFWESVELLLDDPALDVIELSTAVPAGAKQRLTEAFAAAGKVLYLSGGPRLIGEAGLCSPDPRERAQCVDLVRGFVDLASSLSAANLMLVSGRVPEPDRHAASWAALTDSVGQIAEHLRQAGAAAPTLSIETFAREKRPWQLMGPTEESVRWLDSVAADLPELGLTADLSHLAQLGEDPVASVALVGNRTRHMHLSTCIQVPGHPLDGDQHPAFDVPGVDVSTADAARALGTALGAGSGPLTASIEVRPQPGEDPLEVWRRTRGHLLEITAAAQA